MRWDGFDLYRILQTLEYARSKNEDPIRGLVSKPLIYMEILAERTGLEPATPGVTGRYSNQLNYRSKSLVGAAGFEPATFAL